jgi:hypothetical protein
MQLVRVWNRSIRYCAIFQVLSEVAVGVEMVMAMMEGCRVSSATPRIALLLPRPRELCK